MEVSTTFATTNAPIKIPWRDVMFLVVSLTLLAAFMYMAYQIKDDTLHPCETCEKKLDMVCIAGMVESPYLSAFPDYKKTIEKVVP